MKARLGFELKEIGTCLSSFKKITLKAENPDDTLLIAGLWYHTHGDSHLLLRYLFPDGFPSRMPRPSDKLQDEGEYPKGEGREDANSDAEVVGESPKGRAKDGASGEGD